MKNVAFTKVFRDGKLFFDFYGVHINTISNVFSKLSYVHDGCLISDGTRRYLMHGKYYKSVVASVAQPDFKTLSESEWPTMISYLLRKELSCDVTYIDDFHDFLNT